MRPKRVNTPLLTAVGLGGALAGWGAGYFFDGQQGRRRRRRLTDRTGGFVRGRIRAARKAGHFAAAWTHGRAMKATHLREQPKPQPDDATLAQKVESEVFRAAGVPKGTINVNSEHGVVYLRGELEEPELIERLIHQTRKVQGVRDVRSLLHLPQERPQSR
jgi:osmotically-inducible protein OsmY